MPKHKRKRTQWFRPDAVIKPEASFFQHFRSTTFLNAFVLNSILLAFITTFSSRLKVYESSEKNKKFSLTVAIIYAVLGVISVFRLWMWRDISIYIPILAWGTFIILISLTFTSYKADDVHVSEADVPEVEKASNAITSFFATILLALAVYGLMYKLFYFGGGMLTNVPADPTQVVPTVSQPTQEV